jgi:tetratricopeptide (TPR) repeat protein
MKNFAGALEDLDLAIKLKFDYSPAYINRASIKFASGDKKGACKDLEKAEGLNNEKAFNLIEKYCKEFNK